MRSAPLVPRDAAPSDAVVTLRGASFGYGDGTVLSDVDLSIRKGEIVAIVGPNGSGKSTLMKGVLGLNEKVAGTVTLFGIDSTEFHDRARLGYVPQRHTLSASVRATAEEIVATGRLPRIGWLGRLRATDRQIVARSLDVVGLADRAATEVSTLSGGQQRRVLIARALPTSSSWTSPPPGSTPRTSTCSPTSSTASSSATSPWSSSRTSSERSSAC